MLYVLNMEDWNPHYFYPAFSARIEPMCKEDARELVDQEYDKDNVSYTQPDGDVHDGDEFLIAMPDHSAYLYIRLHSPLEKTVV